jgi:hypothetical protein
MTEKRKMKPFLIRKELTTTTEYITVVWAETEEDAEVSSRDIGVCEMEETDSDSEITDTWIEDSDQIEPDPKLDFVSFEGDTIGIEDAWDRVEILPPDRWWELNPMALLEHNGQKRFSFKELSE